MREFILKNRELGDSIYAIYKESIPLVDAEIFPARNGCITCKINGNLIHSGYDPVREAANFGNEKIQGKKIIFVLGMGLGYHINELIKKSNSLVILIELCPGILRIAYENSDLSYLRNIIYYIGKIDGLFSFLTKVLPDELCTSAEILPLAPVTRLFQEDYNKASDIINRVLAQKIQSYMTTIGFGYRWITNSLKNISVLKNVKTPSAKINVPVFILSSGPSLDDALPYLETMKKKGLVLCLSHSFARVAAEGFSPHAVLAIDGGFAVHSHFNKYSQSKDTVLIAALSVHPLVIRHWNGDIIIINIDLPLEETAYPEAVKLPVAGTVAATAYKFARWISSCPCYFAGLDLAFPQGRYHHQGSLAEEKWIFNADKMLTAETQMRKFIRKFNILKVQDWNNREILTNSAMNSYKNWFDQEFQDGEVYLLGSKGAKIEHSQLADWEFIKQLPDIDFTFQLKELCMDKNALNERFSKILSELSKNGPDYQDTVLKMQFSRYLYNQTGYGVQSKKVKKIYESLLYL